MFTWTDALTWTDAKAFGERTKLADAPRVGEPLEVNLHVAVDLLPSACVEMGREF